MRAGPLLDRNPGYGPPACNFRKAQTLSFYSYQAGFSGLPSHVLHVLKGAQQKHTLSAKDRRRTEKDM